MKLLRVAYSKEWVGWAYGGRFWKSFRLYLSEYADSSSVTF